MDVKNKVLPSISKARAGRTCVSTKKLNKYQVLVGAKVSIMLSWAMAWTLIKWFLFTVASAGLIICLFSILYSLGNGVCPISKCDRSTQWRRPSAQWKYIKYGNLRHPDHIVFVPFKQFSSFEVIQRFNEENIFGCHAILGMCSVLAHRTATVTVSNNYTRIGHTFYRGPGNWLILNWISSGAMHDNNHLFTFLRTKNGMH